MMLIILFFILIGFSLFTLYILYHIKNKKIHTVMLGDSITYGGNWNKLLNKKNIVNMGVCCDTTENILARLNLLLKLRPKRVFIMAGINDFGVTDRTINTFENYVSIIETLKAHKIKPFVMATLCTSGDNTKVKWLNQELINYCNENRIDFIDLNTKLAPSGYLEKAYTEDGLHINEKAYEIWADVIKNCLSWN